jgi:hypothetical protein
MTKLGAGDAFVTQGLTEVPPLVTPARDILRSSLPNVDIDVGRRFMRMRAEKFGSHHFPPFRSASSFN